MQCRFQRFYYVVLRTLDSGPPSGFGEAQKSRLVEAGDLRFGSECNGENLKISANDLKSVYSIVVMV